MKPFLLCVLALAFASCAEVAQYDKTHERQYTGSYDADTKTGYVSVTIIPKGFNK